MIQCRQCGQTYGDDASYCNRCGAQLHEGTVDNILDSAEINQEIKQRSRAEKRLAKVLLVLMLLLPFAVAFGVITQVSTLGQKLVLLVLLEALAGGALILAAKRLSGPLPVLLTLSLLLLALPLWGSIIGVFLLYCVFNARGYSSQ
ncbi:MAG: hypothetical protein ACI9Y1_000854 [Lentisphaeria bacterium]|jgi:hypothetical protein